jgi:hypothetical protein
MSAPADAGVERTTFAAYPTRPIAPAGLGESPKIADWLLERSRFELSGDFEESLSRPKRREKSPEMLINRVGSGVAGRESAASGVAVSVAVAIRRQRPRPCRCLRFKISSNCRRLLSA